MGSGSMIGECALRLLAGGSETLYVCNSALFKLRPEEETEVEKDEDEEAEATEDCGEGLKETGFFRVPFASPPSFSLCLFPKKQPSRTKGGHTFRLDVWGCQSKRVDYLSCDQARLETVSKPGNGSGSAPVQNILVLAIVRPSLKPDPRLILNCPKPCACARIHPALSGGMKDEEAFQTGQCSGFRGVLVGSCG